MSFRDFNDEGPGTFGWDFVLGGKYEPVRVNTYKIDPEDTDKDHD